MRAVTRTMRRRLASRHSTEHLMCHKPLHLSSLEACQNQLCYWLSYSYCCTAMLFSSCSFLLLTAVRSCVISSLRFGMPLNFCSLCWMTMTDAGGGGVALWSALAATTSSDLNASYVNASPFCSNDYFISFLSQIVTIWVIFSEIKS